MVEFIEPAITKLVWEAPHRDPNTIAALQTALRNVRTPLAASIAHVLGHFAEDRIHPAVALPALAEACATLVANIHGTVGQAAAEAARYQLEILEPLHEPSPIVQLRRR